MYDFCDNAHVQRQAILKSHQTATSQRAQAHRIVLVAQDTTYVNYTHHPATQGLGILHDANHQGFLLHNSPAITPQREVLGLIDQQILYRDPAQIGKKHPRKQKPIEDKESIKWLNSLQATAQLQAQAPHTQIVSVGDREADIYDLFAQAVESSMGLLVRAAWNRCVDHPERYLWNGIEQQPCSGEQIIQRPRPGKEKPRAITLSIRYGRVGLKPPSHRQNEGLPIVMVDVVLGREESPDPDQEPIEWLLLTTVPVTTLEEARERLGWYACRWMVEIYHKVLKSGCRIEERQLEHADRLERYVTIDSIVAWRILGLTFQSRQTPEVSCETFLEPEEWKALSCWIHQTPIPPLQPPTLRQATRWIAKLGGFLGRKSDGEPGVTVVWRGYQELSRLVSLWKIFNPD